MSSEYPAEIDEFITTKPTDSLANPSHSAKHNKANAAIVAIQETLGTNPQGSEDTVAERLEAIEAATAGGDGDVTGPASATDNHAVLFDGTSGKAIKSAGRVLPAPGNIVADTELGAFSTHGVEDNAYARRDHQHGTGFVASQAEAEAGLINNKAMTPLRTVQREAVHANNPDAHKGQKASIELDDGDLQLVGDEASPGNNKVYGTDGDGIKGWKGDPVGGAWEVDGEVVLGSAVASVVFDNLPATRREWMLYVYSIGTGAQLRFNNDSAGNYARQSIIASGTTTSVSRTVDGTGITYRVDSASSHFIAVHIMQAAAGEQKRTVGSIQGLDGNSIQLQTASGIWTNTTDLIDRIDVVGSAEDFAVGSRFVLLGRP
jgi:hypothetical protein